MKRQMGEYDVLQRTSDSYFNASSILSQWNKQGNSEKKINKFLGLSRVTHFMSIYKDSIEIIKGKSTQQGREPDEIWVSPSLFLFLCNWVDVKLYCDINNCLSQIFSTNNIVKLGYIRDELLFLDVLKRSIETFSPQNECSLQYPIDNGKYRVDFAMIERLHIDNLLYSVTYTIIEYDEEFHERIHDEDIRREEKIRDVLFNQYDKKINVYVDFYRVKKGQEHIAYTLLLPLLNERICYASDEDEIEEYIEVRKYNRYD